MQVIQQFDRSRSRGEFRRVNHVSLMLGTGPIAAVPPRSLDISAAKLPTERDVPAVPLSAILLPFRDRSLS